MTTRALALTAALLLIGACSGSRTAPTPDVTVVVAYTPDPAVIPDPTATGCVHHFAPLQEWVTTSWGDRVRLQPVTGDVLAGTFSRVPIGSQWLFIIDVRFCQDDGGEPRALTGVRVNGVELRRVLMVDDAPVLAFEVHGDGTITP